MTVKYTRKIQGRGLAVGGVVGAILASTCCIVPLILISLGVSGAWIGNLRVLEPYKPIFILVAIGFLGAGYWHVYFKQTDHCDDDRFCAQPSSLRLTKWGLWVGSIITLLALSINYWAPLFY